MKKFISIIITYVFAALCFCITAGADTSDTPVSLILDHMNCLTDSDEAELTRKAKEFSRTTGMNVIIVYTDDIGTPKTDAQVVSYADDTYDEICGINTDGILLLINNDTKYDWISTSGSAINYYSDYRIQRIFDAFYDDLEDAEYYDAGAGFLSAATSYYNRGKANNQQEIFGIEVDLDKVYDRILPIGFIVLVFVLVAGTIKYTVREKDYATQKPNNSVYMKPGATRFSIAHDTFMGRVTHRAYVPRSSSSGGRSGGSGRSSTHRSRSGGRHGGGGRRR